MSRSLYSLLLQASLLFAAAPAISQDVPDPLPPGLEKTPRLTEELGAIRPEPALRVAEAYGFSRWPQIEEVRFTFNVKLPNRDEPIARRWVWRPQTGEVTRGEGAGAVTFIHPLPVGDRPSQEVLEADAQFINDSYWLVFPFQIVWSNPEVIEQGRQPLPIGEGEAEKLTVQYPQVGGYTPGDAYELYLDDANRIIQWIYRKGGGEGGRPATWEGNRQLGPIVVSTEHRGPDRQFRLWFTDLSATVSDTGERVTVEPEPLRGAE